MTSQQDEKFWKRVAEQVRQHHEKACDSTSGAEPPLNEELVKSIVNFATGNSRKARKQSKYLFLSATLLPWAAIIFVCFGIGVIIVLGDQFGRKMEGAVMSGYEVIRWITTPLALVALLAVLIAKRKGKPSVPFLWASLALAVIGVGSYLPEAYWKHAEVVQRTTQQDELRFGGTVLEEGGGLLNGVGISVPGVEASQTDVAGKFMVTIPSSRASETYKVLFTREGYETLEMTVQGPKPSPLLVRMKKKPDLASTKPTRSEIRNARMFGVTTTMLYLPAFGGGKKRRYLSWPSERRLVIF